MPVAEVKCFGLIKIMKMFCLWITDTLACIHEGSVTMERLTRRTSDGKAIPVDWSINIKKDNYNKCLHKLADYEDLEEQGKLIKLPCKVGDKVYFIKSAFSTAAFPIEAKVTLIRLLNCDNDMRYLAITKHNGVDRSFRSSDIGKTVFLTKEEAEIALGNFI